MMSSMNFGGFTLDVHRDRILVSETGNERDPDWRYTDPNGHKHRYAARGPERRLTVPTVHWEVTETYWCSECCDEHEEGHYVCDECGAEVEPGTRYNPLPLYVNGAMDATLSGVIDNMRVAVHLVSDDQLAEVVALCQLTDDTRDTSIAEWVKTAMRDSTAPVDVIEMLPH